MFYHIQETGTCTRFDIFTTTFTILPQVVSFSGYYHMCYHFQDTTTFIKILPLILTFPGYYHVYCQSRILPHGLPFLGYTTHNAISSIISQKFTIYTITCITISRRIPHVLPFLEYYQMYENFQVTAISFITSSVLYLAPGF